MALSVIYPTLAEERLDVNDMQLFFDSYIKQK